MSRLKVLFVTLWYPDDVSPLRGIFIREHAKAVQNFAEVRVLHCAGPSPSVQGLWELKQENSAEFAEGIPTYRVWHRLLPVPSVLPHCWSVVQACNRIMMSGFRPDIVHAHIYYAGIPAVIVGLMNRLPVIISEHWSAFPRKRLNSRAVLMARFALERASAVLPVSHALQKGIEAHNIKANYRVVPNAVDTSLFFPPARSPRSHDETQLLCVARMDHRHNKGILILLQALVRLEEKRTDWQLNLVGDGPARSEYEAIVNASGLADKINFHGMKPRPDVAEFMREADICVLPSLWENLPCVLIESIASGLPIVSTITGGIPEIVDHESGILVPPGDVDALSGALDRMIQSLEKFDRQLIAKKSVRYSHKSVGHLLQNIYEESIESKYQSEKW